jgi:hypothetical protein
MIIKKQKIKWDQPPQTSQNAQTNDSGGYSGEGE